MKCSSRACAGFSLVEVALALGVASVCLVSIFALLPASIATNQNSVQQTIDTTWARAIAADLRATPVTSITSARYGISFPATGTATHTIFLRDDGSGSAQDSDAVASQNPKYRATIYFTAPANSSQKTATMVRILLTWPALADKAASIPPSKYTGSYEIMTAINRN